MEMPDISGCSCKHEPAPCGASCECVCDACQRYYEIEWERQVTRDMLCMNCGMPCVMNLDTLMRTRYVHFFLPCDACEQLYIDIMKLAGRCTLCQDGGLDLSGNCVQCLCTGTDECGCRQCRAAAAAAAAADNSSN